MTKPGNPESAFDLDLSATRLVAVVDDATKGADADWQSTRKWRTKAAHFYARRYTLLYRNPQWPWPNSSNIVLPAIDRYITQYKPAYYSLLHGQPRNVMVLPLDADAQKHANSMDMYMNSVFAGNTPVYSMPDYFKQSGYVVDDMLQYGWGCFKVGYSLRTRMQTRTVTASELPGVLRQLALAPTMSREERNRMLIEYAQNGRQEVLNPRSLLLAFGTTEPINPITPEIFRKISRRLAQIVQELYALDVEDRDDAKTSDNIMQWLAKGARGALRVAINVVVEDTPRVWSKSPFHVIAPPSTTSLRDAERITERMFFGRSEFIEAGRDGKWDMQAMDRVLDGMDKGNPRGSNMLGAEDDGDALQRRRMELDDSLITGQGNRSEEPVELWNSWIRVPLKNSRQHEIISVLYEPQTKAILKARSNPYDHGYMPYVEVPFEVTDQNLYSPRGLGEIINDADKYLTAAHRYAMNSRQLQTGIGFFVRRNSSLDRNKFRYAPSMLFTTDDPQRDAVPIQIPQTAGAWDQEAQFHMMWIQGHIGEVANDITADARLLEPRTAREIQTRDDTRRRMLSMRGMVFLDAIQRMYRMVMCVAKQYAPEKFYAQVTGERPVELRRRDIVGSYDIAPVAAAADMDPSYRSQVALRRANLLMGSAALFNNDPRYRPDVALAIKMALDAEDPFSTKQVLHERTPEEQAMFLAMQQAQAAENSKIAEDAKRVLANAGATPEQYATLIDRIIKMMPHKELTAIIQQGEASRGAAMESMETTSATPEMVRAAAQGMNGRGGG